MRGARLVDHVNRLVGQMAVVDKTRRQFRSGSQCTSEIFNAVMLLEARLEPLKNLYRLFDRGFQHINFLKAPRQRVILFEHAAKLGIGGRADALELPVGQRRLQQVGGIERAARRRARTDQRVNFVDKQNGVRIFLQLLQHRFQPLFKIAAIFGAGQQRTHVERVDRAFLQNVGHAFLDDTSS